MTRRLGVVLGGDADGLFTFQVASSECHKPRRDEVVHVGASAAQVLFPIMPWGGKELWGFNIFTAKKVPSESGAVEFVLIEMSLLARAIY